MLDSAPSDRCFDEMLYWFSLPREDFNVAAFREAVPNAVKESDDAMLFFAPRDQTLGRYYATCHWVFAETTLTFNVEFFGGTRTHAPDEREPYAEDFMPWLGQFAQSAQPLTAHAHGRFRYPVKSRDATFPMVLVAETPCDGELYGIALRVKSAPHGVSSVRLTRGHSEWYAELISQRQFRFDDFSVEADAQALTNVLNAFLKESAT